MSSEPAPLAVPGAVTVRRVESLAEYRACVAIQREIWGADFGECVPASILLVAQKVGGVVAGAFDRGGAMLGFVFGMAGVVDGRPAHWSDMLAVRPAARGAQIGERLKQCQRELARAAGAEAMYWTFDPLVARNAHLNLARLGARVVEYVPDLYGADTGSPLHAGLPTDRLVVRWGLLAGNANVPNDSVSDGGGPNDGAHAEDPLVTPVAADASPAPAEPMPDAERVRLAVPDDFHALPPALRAAWRAGSRAAFLAYLRRGYRVTGFRRAAAGAPPYYVLARDGAAPASPAPAR